MIDPKDMEAVIEKHKGNLYYFDKVGAFVDDLVALIPTTPKQGEVWLTKNEDYGEQPLIYVGDISYPWLGTSETHPSVGIRFQDDYKPIYRLYPPAEATAPTTLSTEDDYRKVPAQTVVKSVSEGVTPAYEKLWSGKWRVTGSSHTYTSEDMSLVARTVIYSPEGEKTAN